MCHENPSDVRESQAVNYSPNDTYGRFLGLVFRNKLLERECWVLGVRGLYLLAFTLVLLICLSESAQDQETKFGRRTQNRRRRSHREVIDLDSNNRPTPGLLSLIA